MTVNTRGDRRIMNTVQSTCVRRRAGWALLALAGLASLAGCVNTANVPVIPVERRLADPPISDGFYCVVGFEEDGLTYFEDDDSDDPEAVNFCTDIDIAPGGALTAPGAFAIDMQLNTDQESAVLWAAPLTRGVTVVQWGEPGEVETLVLFGMIHDDAVALLPPIETEFADVEAAAGVDVVIDPEGVVLVIESGPAEAAFGVLQQAWGRKLDAMLRDPDGMAEFFENISYFVRIGDEAVLDADLPKIAEIAPRVEAVRERIVRAITLE